MITMEHAKKIGISYCADAMGREFVKKFAEKSSTAFSEENDRVFCFLGINNQDESLDDSQNLVLTSNGDSFPYRASCTVLLINGEIEDFMYVHP